MADGLSKVNLGNDEDRLVAEATSAMHGLHIHNPYTSDGPHTKLRKIDGAKTCTCNGLSDPMDAAANTSNMCNCCLKIKSGAVLDGAKVSDSGTEDSSVSSDTPSDTSDTSDSSSCDSESEDSENEQTNTDEVVQHKS